MTDTEYTQIVLYGWINETQMARNYGDVCITLLLSSDKSV